MTSSAGEPEEWADACAGNSRAFAAVYDRHRERVFRLALRLSGSRHDAEDVTASAFLELWRRRGSVRLVGGSVLPWLLVTASNAAKNQARSIRRYRKLIGALPRGDDDDAAGFEAVDDAIDHARLVQELRRMPETDRALLVLTALEGYSVIAAAEALGIRAGAARTRLQRMRARVREAYALSRRLAMTDEGSAR